MRPESWDVAAIAKARGWIDDIRLGCIASFAEIAEREAQGRDRLRGFGGAAAAADRRRHGKRLTLQTRRNLC
jgi:hypothetical protein